MYLSLNSFSCKLCAKIVDLDEDCTALDGERDVMELFLLKRSIYLFDKENE